MARIYPHLLTKAATAICSRTSMSITEATTKQMAEFLNDIEMWCLKDGVRLTCPDDLKYLRSE